MRNLSMKALVVRVSSFVVATAMALTIGVSAANAVTSVRLDDAPATDQVATDPGPSSEGSKSEPAKPAAPPVQKPPASTPEADPPADEDPASSDGGGSTDGADSSAEEDSASSDGPADPEVTDEDAQSPEDPQESVVQSFSGEKPKKKDDDGEKVTICHRTNDADMPYVENSVDTDAIDGVGDSDHYGEHTGPLASTTQVAQQLKDAHTKWGDIIPALSGVHTGLNLEDGGEEILAAHCVVPTTPPPAPEKKGVGQYIYKMIDAQVGPGWPNSGKQYFCESKTGSDYFTTVDLANCDIPDGVVVDSCWAVQEDKVEDWTYDGPFNWPSTIQYPVDNIGWPPIYDARHYLLSDVIDVPDCVPPPTECTAATTNPTATDLDQMGWVLNGLVAFVDGGIEFTSDNWVDASVSHATNFELKDARNMFMDLAVANGGNYGFAVILHTALGSIHSEDYYTDELWTNNPGLLPVTGGGQGGSYSGSLEDALAIGNPTVTSVEFLFTSASPNTAVLSKGGYNCLVQPFDRSPEPDDEVTVTNGDPVFDCSTRVASYVATTITVSFKFNKATNKWTAQPPDTKTETLTRDMTSDEVTENCAILAFPDPPTKQQNCDAKGTFTHPEDSDDVKFTETDNRDSSGAGDVIITATPQNGLLFTDGTSVKTWTLSFGKVVACLEILGLTGNNPSGLVNLAVDLILVGMLGLALAYMVQQRKQRKLPKGIVRGDFV